MTDNTRALLEQALEKLLECWPKSDPCINGIRAALAEPDDVAEEMSAVADQYAHKLALDLECVLADYSGTWYDTAICTLGAYRGAMNAIHERESPTFMGEPAIRPTQEEPAPDDRHRQELLAMEITLQNMAERHTQELRAYELTVANLRAELLKAKPVGKGEPFAYTTGVYSGRFTVEPTNRATVIPAGVALYLHPPAPAWHDAPNAPGNWWGRSRRTGESERFNEITQREIDDAQPWFSKYRWYGPIPQDIKAEGGAA